MATAASIRIPTESAVLNGALQMPAAARGLIAVVHAGTNDSYGNPSSAIDGAITRRGYGTLVVNLLTPAEESAERASGSYHLDVPFLATRVCQVLGALRCHPDCRHEALGIVAEGMAAAGAIVSASHHGEVQAVVSLNGRADLAGDVLKQMSAPTLLLVAKDQRHVVDLNRKAAASLGSVHTLEIVETPGLPADAGRLIGERAADWFDAFVGAEPAAEPWRTAPQPREDERHDRAREHSRRH